MTKIDIYDKVRCLEGMLFFGRVGTVVATMPRDDLLPAVLGTGDWVCVRWDDEDWSWVLPESCWQKLEDDNDTQQP